MTKAEKCNHFVREGKQALYEATSGYMRFGLILEKLIGKGGVWRSYAKGFDNRSEFVRDAFKLSLSMCDHIRRVTKTFSPYIKDKTIPFYRLLNALPLIKNKKVDVSEIIECASSLEPVAWDTQIKAWKGKPDRDLCAHEKTELWERCANPDCGKWLRKL
jgi:hypothetical protein